MSTDEPQNGPEISYGEQSGAQGPPAAGAKSDQQQQVQVQLNEAAMETVYTNYFLLSTTPEEIALSLAFNSGTTNQIPMTHRVIMNYYTAKRMLGGLQAAIGRYEQAFGELETDVNKRQKKS